MSKKSPQSERKGKAELVVLDFNPQASIGLAVEAIQQNKTKKTPLRTFHKQALPVKQGAEQQFWLFVCNDKLPNNTLLYSQSLLPHPATDLHFVDQLQLEALDQALVELQKRSDKQGKGKRANGREPDL